MHTKLVGLPTTTEVGGSENDLLKIVAMRERCVSGLTAPRDHGRREDHGPTSSSPRVLGNGDHAEPEERQHEGDAVRTTGLGPFPDPEYRQCRSSGEGRWGPDMNFNGVTTIAEKSVADLDFPR